MFGYNLVKKMVGRELTVQKSMIARGEMFAGNIPLILGPQGIGKTTMAAEFASEYDLRFVQINSGENSDGTDLSGIPIPHESETGETYLEWALNKQMLAGCHEPCLIFLDDLDKAPPPCQNALIGITGTRYVRDVPLHPSTLILGAGNRAEDDEIGNPISESLRTRMTVIEMMPDAESFVKHGTETQSIHRAVSGYITYNPHHLFMADREAYRFPTPRGWWEASQHMDEFNDPHEKVGSQPNWKSIVARKCGDAVANEFWAWFTILSEVDVDAILATGVTTGKAGSSTSKRMLEYATVFAVSAKLRDVGIKKSQKGLPIFVNSLSKEMRVAFVVQLPIALRARLGKAFPDAADAIMSQFITSAQQKE